MRFSLRLLLIGTVAACAPMLPEPDVTLPALPSLPIVGPAETPAPAETPPTQPATPPAADPADQAGFEGWKEGFLRRHGGARRAEYERELAGLTPDPSVIRLDRNQPEFSRPVGAYLANAVNGARIAEARRRTTDVPWAVTQRFGVPAEILVAIWANESGFGRIQGDYDVIRSLATLAFDGRRRDWAEAQLKDALDIVVDGRRARSGLKGSWAGAMGQTQFIPITICASASIRTRTARSISGPMTRTPWPRRRTCWPKPAGSAARPGGTKSSCRPGSTIPRSRGRSIPGPSGPRGG